MYKRQQQNLRTLARRGVHIVEPGEGELASGLQGKGRMAEPDAIAAFVGGLLREKKKNLQGKRLIVTAGATIEAIDPVRFISNHSSGKMGYALSLIHIWWRRYEKKGPRQAAPAKIPTNEGVCPVRHSPGEADTPGKSRAVQMLMSRISKWIVPAGTSTSTRSPFLRPSSAFAIGVPIASLPSRRFASCSATIV